MKEMFGYSNLKSEENTTQGRENFLNIGCAVYNIWLKNWLRKAKIFVTSDLNIGCANAPCALGSSAPAKEKTFARPLLEF